MSAFDPVAEAIANSADATACQTPLVDLLRAMPADAILRWNDGPYSSHSAPVGKYAREAADALAAQAAEIERMREALSRITAIENEDFGGDWDEINRAREIARQALVKAG